MNLIEIIKNNLQRLDQTDRLRIGGLIAGLLAIAIVWSAFASKVETLQRKSQSREAVLKELLPLKVAYQSSRIASEKLNSRIAALHADDTPAKLFEDTGIRGKSVRMIPLKSEERNGFTEDATDIRVEGITINEAINLLYRLEKGSYPSYLKKCTIRQRFDDQTRSDLAMTLVLVRPLPGQSKK